MQGMPQAAGAPHLADDKDLGQDHPEMVELTGFQSTKYTYVEETQVFLWQYIILSLLIWIDLVVSLMAQFLLSLRQSLTVVSID